MSFSQPLWLWLAPLALLPMLRSLHHGNMYSWNGLLPHDPLSSLVRVVILAVGVMAMLLLISGLSGLFRGEYSIPRSGYGANLVLLLDRSRSMDDSFAGRSPSGAEESKSRAAVRFLEGFINSRHIKFATTSAKQGLAHGYSAYPIRVGLHNRCHFNTRKALKSLVVPCNFSQINF